MRFNPERMCGERRINANFSPPRAFVTAAMEFAMVAATKRNGELIANLSTKGSALREAQVMSIGRRATADQARLLGHMSDVFPVTNPTRL